MKHWLRVAQFLLDPKIAPDASPAVFARWAQPLGSVSLGDCKAVGGLSTAPRAASRRLGQHLQSYITEATFESQILLSLSNSANKLVNIPQMINAVQTCTTLVDLERCYRMRFYSRKSVSIQPKTSLPIFHEMEGVPKKEFFRERFSDRIGSSDFFQAPGWDKCFRLCTLSATFLADSGARLLLSVCMILYVMKVERSSCCRMCA